MISGIGNVLLQLWLAGQDKANHYRREWRLDARIFHAKITLGVLGGQLDKESGTICIPVPDQGQLKVSKAKVY